MKAILDLNTLEMQEDEFVIHTSWDKHVKISIYVRTSERNRYWITFRYGTYEHWIEDLPVYFDDDGNLYSSFSFWDEANFL